MGRWNLGPKTKELEDKMRQKFGIQINSKSETDLIIAALEAYVAANPQAKTVIFSDLMKRLSILQVNLTKIEDLETRKQQAMNQPAIGSKSQRNPLPAPQRSGNARQSSQVQQRNQRVLGQQNLPRR